MFFSIGSDVEYDIAAVDENAKKMFCLFIGSPFRLKENCIKDSTRQYFEGCLPSK